MRRKTDDAGAGVVSAPGAGRRPAAAVEAAMWRCRDISLDAMFMRPPMMVGAGFLGAERWGDGDVLRAAGLFVVFAVLAVLLLIDAPTLVPSYWRGNASPRRMAEIAACGPRARRVETACHVAVAMILCWMLLVWRRPPGLDAALLWISLVVTFRTGVMAVRGMRSLGPSG